MKLLVDFLPIIAFFAVYKIYGALVSADDAMFAATIAIMLVMTIQISIQWIRTRTVNRILLVSGVLVLVFGGITLALRDIRFIQWKPTILNWLLAAACLISHFVGKQNLIERMLSEAIALPKHVWQRLNFMWVVTFALIGAVNLYVVYNYSQEAWVNFKWTGLIGLPLLMGLIQGIYIARYIPDDTANKS
jgi:intracellular septation protein